jgi:hypothetical protein
MISINKLFVVEMLVAIFVLGCAVASGDVWDHDKAPVTKPAETRR